MRGRIIHRLEEFTLSYKFGLHQPVSNIPEVFQHIPLIGQNPPANIVTIREICMK